jgi:DNA-binding beta-propeller fold protein YncE
MRRRWIRTGLVLAVLAGGTVAAVRLARPDPALRTFSAGSFPYAVAVSPAGRAFVVNRTSEWTGLSADGGSVSVLDLRSGTVVRRVPVGADPRAIAVAGPEGRVFVANDDDASVSVLDARRGAPLRTTRVGPGPRALALDMPAHRVFVVSAGDGAVSVLDARSGALLRTIHLDAVPSYGSTGSSGLGSWPTTSRGIVPPFGSAAVAALGGRVFVGSGRAVMVLDARSGALLRTVMVTEAVRHLAADPRTGHVFIAGETAVRLLDARHTWAVRTIAAGEHPSALAIDARRGRVFVADMGATDANGIPTGAGSVAIVNAATGAVLRTVPVGVAPSALAIDERTGRAVVVNAGGPVHRRGPWDALPRWLVRRLPFLASPDPDTRTVAGSVGVLSP